MTTRADLFAEFVAQLSRHADEHGTGRDLAAGLFVSRSLLDRLVKAAAGEPAAGLRRRLLLERAACRLRDPGASVLDVAVEAGYSSGEAFCRAFRRAYGRSPSAWRGCAATIQLGPRDGLHFYPPGGFRLPARREETAMTFTADQVDHHVAVLGQLLDRAAALTDEQLDAPLELPGEGIDASPTIRSLLARLVGQLEMWTAAMASRPYDLGSERHAAIAELRSRVDLAGPEFAAFVRDACDGDRLGETFVDTTGPEPYVFTAAGMIAHVLTYAAYRRTVVVSALAAQSVPDVDDDPLSWFVP